MRLSQLISLPLFLWGGIASGFTIFGDSKEIKGWNTDVLSFHLNPSDCPSNIQALLDEAMNIWNQVPSSGIRVQRGDETDLSLYAALGGQATLSPTIHCVTDMNALGANPAVIPGFATGVALDAERRIAAGVLILNAQAGAAANIENMDEGLVISVIAHEIGHVLGLGHTPDTSALMYYDASLREVASLSQDDVDGISYLYPRDELGEHGPLGCGNLASSGSTRSFSYLLFLIPLLILVFRRITKKI